MGDWLSGYLNVLKAPGETSHAVVARVRRLIGQRRVGHAGTLDPAAVGVLPVAVGVATRLAMAPGWDMKMYWADVRFGTATSTDDAEGTVVARGDSSGVDPDRIEWGLEAFVGDVDQQPPAYSAVHVQGARAYERARSGARRGVPLQAPEARRVRIDAIRIVYWMPPVVSLLIQCRSGTYVRALARDLGIRLGCPAHLSALVRLRVGPFAIDDALFVDDLEALSRHQAWERVLWPVDLPVAELGTLVVAGTHERGFRNGQSWPARQLAQGSKGFDDVRVFGQAGDFLGLATARGLGLWRPRVVLGSVA